MMQNYDGSLHMFIQPPQPVKLHRLAFLRWLVEHGMSEHEVAGPASGPLVAVPEKVEAAA